MKLKVQHVMDATLVISQIIREQRPMPQRGKFKLARLHAKLLPEFTTITATRDQMITAYGYHAQIPDPAWADTGASNAPMIESPEFQVPDDKLAEFNAAWAEIGNQEINVDIEPIPLADLDLGVGQNGSIEANELIALGELVD